MTEMVQPVTIPFSSRCQSDVPESALTLNDVAAGLTQHVCAGRNHMHFHGPAIAQSGLLFPHVSLG